MTPDLPSDDTQTEPVSPERRTFLTRLSLGLTTLGAALVGIPFIGFLTAPVRRPAPEVWRPVGAVEDFPIGTTHKVIYVDPEPLPWAGFVAESAAYLRRVDAETFIAFSIYCTHTGCPVHWVERSGLFFCPCHGGAFNHDGSVAAGPPPRDMDRHETRVRQGRVEVRTRPIPLPPPGT